MSTNRIADFLQPKGSDGASFDVDALNERRHELASQIPTHTELSGDARSSRLTDAEAQVFGINLSKMMIAWSVTKYKFSCFVHMSVTAVGQWVDGMCKPLPNSLRCVAEALKCNEPDLYDHEWTVKEIKAKQYLYTEYCNTVIIYEPLDDEDDDDDDGDAWKAGAI